MSLYIDNIIDPIAVIKEGRELSSCPWHFVKVKCGRTKSAHNWVWKNLTGRFSAQADFIAFEDPAEASMFGLIVDQFSTDDRF
jgi:hypothetical protein